MGNNKLIWDADDYNSSNGAQYRDANETIEQIVKDGADKNDMIVVDFGCGSGNVTKMLYNRLSHKKIFACDFDENMVNYAKDQSHGENIEYFVQNISLPWEQLDERLKSLEGKVDLLWSNRVLHWVPDKQTVAKTIARLLKPGGRCYINITLFRDALEFESDEVKKEVLPFYNFPSHQEQTMYWNKYFKNSGLSSLNIDFLEKDWTYDNQKQKDQMFQALKPYLNLIVTDKLKELSTEEKAALEDSSIDLFWKSFATPYGKNPQNFSGHPLHVYYQQYRVIGTK